MRNKERKKDIKGRERKFFECESQIRKEYNK